MYTATSWLRHQALIPIKPKLSFLFGFTRQLKPVAACEITCFGRACQVNASGSYVESSVVSCREANGELTI